MLTSLPSLTNHTALTHQDELLQIAFLTSSVTGPLPTINLFFLSFFFSFFFLFSSHVCPRCTRLRLLSAFVILPCYLQFPKSVGYSGGFFQCNWEQWIWRSRYATGRVTVCCVPQSVDCPVAYSMTVTTSSFSTDGLLPCNMACFLAIMGVSGASLPTQVPLPSHLYNNHLFASPSVCVSVL